MLGLARDEQEMLEGREGPARQKAMELLVKYAEGLGAERFVDTNNVTVIVGSIPDVKIVEKVVPSLDADEIASKFLLDSDETVVPDISISRMFPAVINPGPGSFVAVIF